MLEKTVRSLNPNSSPLQEYGPQVLANICLFHHSKKQPIFCGEEVIVTGFFILTSSTDLSFIGSSSTCQRPSGLVYILILMKLFPYLFPSSPRSLWLFYMIQFPDDPTFQSPSLDVFVICPLNAESIVEQNDLDVIRSNTSTIDTLVLDTIIVLILLKIASDTLVCCQKVGLQHCCN